MAEVTDHRRASLSCRPLLQLTSDRVGGTAQLVPHDTLPHDRVRYALDFPAGARRTLGRAFHLLEGVRLHRSLGVQPLVNIEPSRLLAPTPPGRPVEQRAGGPARKCAAEPERCRTS